MLTFKAASREIAHLCKTQIHATSFSKTFNGFVEYSSEPILDELTLDEPIFGKKILECGYIQQKNMVSST